MRRLLLLPVLAVALAGCSASPRATLQGEVEDVISAANSGDADGVRLAVEDLLSTISTQVGSSELAPERAEQLRTLALEVQAQAGALEPEPSPSPSPSPEPTEEPSPSPSPSPEPEPTEEPSPEPEPEPSPEPEPTEEPEPSPEPEEPDEPEPTEEPGVELPDAASPSPVAVVQPSPAGLRRD